MAGSKGARKTLTAKVNIEGMQHPRLKARAGCSVVGVGKKGQDGDKRDGSERESQRALIPAPSPRRQYRIEQQAMEW